MSPFSTTRSFWFRARDPLSPRERLRKAVADLTRARRLQVLVDYGFAGLLAGLGLAAVAVLVARVMLLAWPTWPLAGAVVFGAVAVALLAGWWRRPATLEVAIHADLKLKLKQRLSTAWEFLTAHQDEELTERLAVQAVNAGLPADPWAVFPLRVNRWGWLAPLVATALLLAAVIEVDRAAQAPSPRAPDERVVSEGERLGAFGRAMQERAARERLPRSARQAAELERLGARMESGALSRTQAVGELRRRAVALEEERQQALADAGGADGGRRGADQRSPRADQGSPAGDRGSPREKGSAAGSGLNAEAMLDRMRRGSLDSADLRALARYQKDLGSGTAGQALEKALQRHRAGVDDALRQILENLALTERARKEDRELGRAREQVLRARENLGDAQATARGQGPRAEIDWDDDERGDRDAGSAESARPDARRASESGRADPSSASRGDGVATDRAHSPYRPEPGPRGPVLQPQGEIREGEAHSSHARLPARAGRSNVENVELAREFAPQVEEVLAREHYPAHYKEFIRRYFLNLSRGARGAPGEAGGTQ
jgi:hypothetical protein